ncbi:MAG: septum formation family protein [Acidimicrobiia bacterium]
MRSRSTLIPGILLALVATACTGDGNAEETPAPETPSTVAEDSPGTTAQPIDPSEPVTTAMVASRAITKPDGYASIVDVDASAAELVNVGLAWLPDAIVSEVAHDVVSSPSGDVVSIVSVIPSAEWRGAPDLPEMLVELLSGSEAGADENRIVATESAEGQPMFLWSTGDGFLIAMSDNADAATWYLELREAARTPNPVWTAGSCLMVPGGEFPYAPFPMDYVVPCTALHNAEVIAAEFSATTAEEFDAGAIEADRTFACDQAYSTTFGPEIDHRPGLVTYMPDEAEWNRGDRYRACVVSISSDGTAEEYEGAMADRDDLAWNLAPGDCLPAAIKAAPLPCASVHVHEFMGLAEVPFDAWPAGGDASFDAACEGYLEDVTEGPVDVGIWAYGLGPYEFEQGARNVRCLVFAIGDAAPTLITGSFTGQWRVFGDTVSV